MDSCSGLSQTELEISEARTLYLATSKFVGDLHNDGIKTFNVAVLVEELIKAEQIFKGLSLYKEKILKIPELAKKAKLAMKLGLATMQVISSI